MWNNCGRCEVYFCLSTELACLVCVLSFGKRIVMYVLVKSSKICHVIVGQRMVLFDGVHKWLSTIGNTQWTWKSNLSRNLISWITSIKPSTVEISMTLDSLPEGKSTRIYRTPCTHTHRLLVLLTSNRGNSLVMWLHISNLPLTTRSDLMQNP